ncbi:phosphocarrier protein [Halogranum gelatinilyticum]|uniref:Phosphocarrier protein n=1 Tax=Halogranum gelatinilyticum TaxID=660521 RepID=A0A1G9VXK5_9EURY|nr:HPr family phosphocarrier protein [Halogranum gelatinilyticum]SDM76964.1 phosphocarrier protein [Halogranum gelatinilyticum]
MTERVVTVATEAGLHARPADVFVETAKRFDADLRLSRADSDDVVAADSMIGVNSLNVRNGEDVRLVAEGPDAEEALDALEAVLTTPEAELRSD